mmetsp:Transcript_9751/g.16227  ORF Transcript_9751/g.16227 Transcript_9751/m.16227 type:complete len:260 (-) Transcript_9751:105-884(-)
MTAVHQTRHGDSCSQGLDKNFQYIIVTNLSSALKIDGNERFVESIIFVSILVTDATAVTRIMKKNDIACLAVLSNTLKGVHNVLLCRGVMSPVIHQLQHVGWRKAVHILEELSHIFSIVVTSTQLTLLALVIDTNYNGSLGTGGSWRDNEHFVLDVNHSRRSQLRNLIVTHVFQDCSHSSQKCNPRQVFLVLTLVLVEDLEQRRCARTSCSPSWIGKLKGGNIAHIGTGLTIVRPRDHVNHGRNALRNFSIEFLSHREK